MERLVLLFSGLCLLIQSISCQYVLIKERKNWDEAQAYCRQNHIDLATVQNNEDWTNVQRDEQPALTSAVWTGLYSDITSWRWSFQDETMTFVNWGTGEPNNYAGKQTEAGIGGGKWTDLEDYYQIPFFCYNEEETGASRFVFITSPKTWRKAQSYCRQHHTDLATIRSQSENDQLQQMMQGVSKAWIGLFRDSWKWSNGANVNMSAINWMTGQPNLGGLNIRPCAAKYPNGFIDDRVCSDALPFICAIPKKHIVRLEVKSAENVNDPAVMESILQRIKQKARDHGIDEETRLSWKVQSNGNVFSVKRDQKDDAQKKTCEGM
ncbi:putative C-type lectin domain family 20 member A isoform X2 [Triplophysa dalaica]|uniref:putative C-type lectin domain family 20 member A isoform X2 n=1 Tax=Triplophysa dalaica TaxID=1582913 RepID=UPI0024DFBEAA|nr:putative C-type lectin domain family 20 member A isoform X2 [Triplophysa dalaica]